MLLSLRPDSDAKLIGLRDALAAADRPESIYTWMRSPKVRTTLQLLGSGALTVNHDSFDTLPQDRQLRHLRAVLVSAGLLPQRDEALHQLEHWIASKVGVLDEDLRQSVDRFASWHHLRRIRRNSTPNNDSHAAAHNAKQEITAAIDFLLWLQAERNRRLHNCPQADIDLWLTTGTTTRYTIRTFIVFAVKERIAPPLTVPFRQPHSSRRLTRENRLDWIRTCLDSSDETTLRSRVAALLLLLFAQPLVRVAELQLDAIKDTGSELTILFECVPVVVPDPFAGLVRRQLNAGQPSRTRAFDENRWLFPGGRAGRHITHSYLMTEIRQMGINVLAAKNRTLDDLVTEMPAALVADTLGYSYQVTELHKANAGGTYARYAGFRGKQSDSRKG